MKKYFERYRIDNGKVIGKTELMENDDGVLVFTIFDYQSNHNDEPFIQALQHTYLCGSGQTFVMAPLYITIDSAWFTIDCCEDEIFKVHDKFLIEYISNNNAPYVLHGRKFAGNQIIKIKQYGTEVSRLKLYASNDWRSLYVAIPYDIAGDTSELLSAITKLNAKIDDALSDDGKINLPIWKVDSESWVEYAVRELAKKEDKLRLEIHRFEQRSFFERLKWLFFGK